MNSAEQQPVFRDLSAEDADPEVTEIESLCMNCHANGTTRLLLTRIPHYKNVILMSFSCEECGFENNEIQPGGAFAEQGVRWKLRVEMNDDMNRQVVKSDYTSVLIPELDFEIPAQSQKGEVTTVEGIISRAISGLAQDQVARQEEHPEAAEQIDGIIDKLTGLRNLDRPWTLLLEDVSGNCYVENPSAPHKDPRCERTDFDRSKEQDHALGVFTHEEVSEDTSNPSLLKPVDPEHYNLDKIGGDEIMTFRTNCPECNAPADTNMKMTNIPHFKEVLIMATTCDACGLRTNEVKSGGGVEDQGVRFEVRVAGKEDFSRDVLKSETCSMAVPELDLEVGGRALGGRFSTPEGLLRATRDQLAAGLCGDAPVIGEHNIDLFIEKLDEVLECKRAITIVLDDPAGNSFVQSLNDDDPNVPDDGLKITRYERSFEQNEELGLNDMKTENYEGN